MKEIPLTRGLVTIVDDEDFGWLNQFEWCACGLIDKIFYAQSRIEGQRKYMHRFILNANQGDFIDHKDGNGLNNTRENLRFATRSQNKMNQKKQHNNKSGFKGVYFSPANYLKGHWLATIFINDKSKYLGCFSIPEEAASAYDEAAIKYFGEFAKTNKDLGLLESVGGRTRP